MFNMAKAIFVFVFVLLQISDSAALTRRLSWSCHDENKCVKYFGSTPMCMCCDGYYMTWDMSCVKSHLFGFSAALEYTGPRFTNCPTNPLQVNVHRYNNKAVLTHTLKAEDWEGRPLSVTYSQTLFEHCGCSYSPLTYVTAKSAHDRHGNSETCNFTVIVKDKYPPVIMGCPHDIYTSDKNPVQWNMPRVTDNVGVKSLQEPEKKNNSKFDAGYYTLTFNATDFDENSATCSFRVFVYNSRTYSKRNTDTPVIISGTVIAALMVLLVVMSFAMVRIFKKRRQLRNRHPVAYYGARLARGGNDDIPVFVLNSEPPSYSELFADKPPDYTDVSYLPSYEHYLRLAAQSSRGMTHNGNRGHDNLSYVSGNEGLEDEHSTTVDGNEGQGHKNFAFVENENQEIQYNKQSTNISENQTVASNMSTNSENDPIANEDIVNVNIHERSDVSAGQTQTDSQV